MAGIEKDQYDALAATYNAIEELPQSVLYQEDVRRALGDCTGKTILDLGGGTGLHARNALALGAKVVDVVDVSPEMLAIGKRLIPYDTSPSAWTRYSSCCFETMLNCSSMYVNSEIDLIVHFYPAHANLT